MDYYEIMFTWESSLDTTIINDVLAAALGEIGFESFVQHPDSLVAYVPAISFEAKQLEACLAQFPLENVRFRYTSTCIKAKDWNEEWEKNYFQPVRIGNDCVMRAPFHPEEPGVHFEIIIHPKMAFGTGNHETTTLMIRAMLALELEGKEVLDMGCGTGVLAILASKKGAGRTVAIDVDEWAYRNALENCLLNHTPDIQVVLGDAGHLANTADMFDYIFANINRNILLRDIPTYSQALKPNGELFLSGFYTEDIPVLEAQCNQHGLRSLSLTVQNNWAALRILRNL